MTVRFSSHALNKIRKELSKLGITEELVKEILNRPELKFYDSATDRYIAVNMNFKVAVIYEEKNKNIFVITVIYSSKMMQIIEKRKRIGRWI